MGGGGEKVDPFNYKTMIPKKKLNVRIILSNGDMA
jgi:hypothetical protein